MDRLMSREDVEAMLADGRNVLIVDQYVLKVDAWLNYHPGGDKAILHMVGKDATDEVTVYVYSRAQILSPNVAPQLTLLPGYILKGRSIR